MARNRQKIENRNLNIWKRYKDLYGKERKRIDDVLSILSDEFFLAESTISKIIFQMARAKTGNNPRSIGKKD